MMEATVVTMSMQDSDDCVLDPSFLANLQFLKIFPPYFVCCFLNLRVGNKDVLHMAVHYLFLISCPFEYVY